MKNDSPKTPIIFLASLALCAVVAFTACKTTEAAPQEAEAVLPEPEPTLLVPILSMPSMSVVKANSTMVELMVSVNVENPNDCELPPFKILFDYKVNDALVLKRKYENKSVMAPSSVTPVIFGLVVYYNDLFRIVPDLLFVTEASSMIDMTFDFAVPAFSGEVIRLQIPCPFPLNHY